MSDVDLSRLRDEIDALDEELVSVFVKRQETARKIGEIKKEKGLNITNSLREKEVIEHVRKLSGDRYADDTEKLYEAIFNLSKKNQE